MLIGIRGRGFAWPYTVCRSFATVSKDHNPKINTNACGIQQLSDELHKQIFPVKSLPGPLPRLTKLSLKYLEDNELLGKPCSVNPPININLPTLQGTNISQHFENLGLKSISSYEDHAENLIKIGLTPLEKPKRWVFESGWTRYAPFSEPQNVPYPLENELVYDCEVMYKCSPYPVMATCLSPKAWYSWCSPYLTGDSATNNHLIPFATDKRECTIVGHNVSFDRARILEEYNMSTTKAFFLDTMSLHVAVSGMCTRQRNTWMKYKKNLKEKKDSSVKTLDEYREMIRNEDLRLTMANMILDDESVEGDTGTTSALRDDPWMKNSSLNKLSDVAELHCGIKMDKQLRDHFATTSVAEIREQFQKLMTYCANDVVATYHVFYKVYPKFKEVVPHPVSFAALRHITSSILPTSTDWEDYIRRCEEMYQKSKTEVEEKVHQICNEVVSLRKNAQDEIPPWEEDPWLSQLDWEIKPVRLTKSGVPYKNQKLPGYPEWYKKLVAKDKLNLTIKSRTSILLLRLLWEGKPIFWTETKGWCFVVDQKESAKFQNSKYLEVNPLDILMQIHANTPKRKVSPKKKSVSRESSSTKSKESSRTKKTSKSIDKPTQHMSTEDANLDLLAVDLPPRYAESDHIVRENLKKLIANGKTLFKIPHENGQDARVTSLISKPFLRYYEEGILSSENSLAREAFQTNVTNSYWISSRERIMNQYVVYESDLNKAKPFRQKGEKEVGFIIPQIVPMGTITRRAVEKTWLTALNAKKNRLGSELKSLIQAPPGYCFVGADVDSEELWIASLVGDSVFRLHGGTALGWMTLEGTKNSGTDLHSKTANILGISRNEAKVFNYGRIYGAGVKFATSLLKKFNPAISEIDADKVAKTLYAETKGKTSVVKFPESGEKIKVWYGGSESVVFNRLESIAEQDNPKTPVLGAGITAALNRTNLNSNSFLPSRINWAIQSSGVDYLHLLLVSMEYLTKLYNVDARLSITVHDEVRYLSKIEDRYKCAMLLQIANLWTRAMFCFQLGIENVPQSCAFFSCVDIDHVLRKEVDFDCITPSNPSPISHGESLDIYSLLKKKEVQDMLNSLNDKPNCENLLENKQKTSRPVEKLDIKFDTSTKLKWIELQISKTEKEFKEKKKAFFQAADTLVLENFAKKLKNIDNSNDEVVLNGLFVPNCTAGELLDSGKIIEENWDALINERKADKKFKGSKNNKVRKDEDHSTTDLLIERIATDILDKMERKPKSKCKAYGKARPSKKTCLVESDNKSLTLSSNRKRGREGEYVTFSHTHLTENELREIMF